MNSIIGTKNEDGTNNKVRTMMENGANIRQKGVLHTMKHGMSSVNIQKWSNAVS